MEKYEQILKMFRTYTYYDDIIHTKSYITIDNIHDAIIYEGINMDKPISYYVQKAKHLALNDMKTNKNREAIINRNAKNMLGKEFDFDTFVEYGFNDEEERLVIEIVTGVTISRSQFTRTKREKILSSIKSKVIQCTF